ncbi:MAG TPA: non-canonical purine NTP pyrophosphatase [Candidatus Nitrosotalea sp.]|nr:non-canonical purine NTP pyrophosphatase [Candidatus Nitrosotalea sp.]
MARATIGRMAQFIIATRNRHKAEEIRDILTGPHSFLTLAEFGDAPILEEDEDTFAGNASRKAIKLALWVGSSRESKRIISGDEVWVMADDSGLEVDALNGAPGVHSARFAALDTGLPHNSTDAENNAKLIRLLADVPPERRTARFRCVLAVVPLQVQSPAASPASQTANESELAARTELFEGVCPGRMIVTPSGNGGFGYDPLFIPDGYDRSFAELDPAIKNRISHRAKAVAKLQSRLS